MGLAWPFVAHIGHPDSIVHNKRARRTKQNNAAVRWVVHQIVANDSGTTADADTIGPLLEGIRTTWADVVVLNYDVVAEETTFRDVHTGPTAWIIRVHVFNQLVRIRATHLDICAATSWRCAGTGPIDLKRRSGNQQLGTKCEDAHLDIAQLDATAIGASTIDGGRVTLSICHWATNNKSCPSVVGRIARGADLLIRCSE